MAQAEIEHSMIYFVDSGSYVFGTCSSILYHFAVVLAYTIQRCGAAATAVAGLCTSMHRTRYKTRTTGKHMRSFTPDNDRTVPSNNERIFAESWSSGHHGLLNIEIDTHLRQQP